jgi:hypothetical protein
MRRFDELLVYKMTLSSDGTHLMLRPTVLKYNMSFPKKLFTNFKKEYYENMNVGVRRFYKL